MKSKKKQKNNTFNYNYPEEREIFDRAYWINKVLTHHDRERHSPNMLACAPECIQIDEEINYVGVTSGNHSLNHLHSCFKNNKAFILRCLKNYQGKPQGLAVWALDDSIKNDEEINLLAYKIYSFNLVLGSYQLAHNYEYLKKAMAIDGLGFEYIKNTKDLTLAKIAFEQNPKILQWARRSVANQLCKDVKRVKNLLDENLTFINYISPSLKNNLTFMQPYLEKSPAYISLAGKKIKDNENYMRSFLNKHLVSLSHCSERLRSDPVFCLEYIQKWGDNYKYITPVLSQNLNFARQAIQVNSSVYQYLNKTHLEDVSVLRFALENPNNWKHLPMDLLNRLYLCVKEDNPDLAQDSEMFTIATQEYAKRLYQKEHMTLSLNAEKTIKPKLKV